MSIFKMKIIFLSVLFQIFIFFSRGSNVLDFDKVIKFLKENGSMPDYMPDLIDDIIQVIPPYLIYKYNEKIYHLHNNIDAIQKDVLDVEATLPEPPEPGLEPPIPEKGHPEPSHPKVPSPEALPVAEPLVLNPKLEPEEPLPDAELEDKTVDVDAETGIEEENKPKVIKEIMKIPKVVELSPADKEKNTVLYIFNKGTQYNLKEIIEYKETNEVFNNLEKGYKIFYKSITIAEEEGDIHNVTIDDYSGFLKALHILFKENDEKQYTINHIHKKDLIYFFKHLYINVYNSLKKYLFFIGYNFDDYVYTVENFSLNNLLNDYFSLTDSNFADNGSVENILKKIKYAKTAKDKLTLKKIENSIKHFLRSNNLKVLDLKLFHHLFSKYDLLNYNENDIIKYATDLVNITQINISPRVIATLIRYFLEKINIFLLPSYPTYSFYSYKLYLENNDLLVIVEDIYITFFNNFFNKYLIINSVYKHEKGFLLEYAPWIKKVYSDFDSTYDFNSLKYGVVLFQSFVLMFKSYFNSNIKIKTIIEDSFKTSKVDTLDKFLNELINLFEIVEKEPILPKPALVVAAKPVERKLSEIELNEEPPDDEQEEFKKKVKKREELRKKLELELEEERKKMLQEKEEEKKKKSQEEEELKSKKDQEEEKEFKKLEEEEELAEVIQDEEFDREYEEDYRQELEYAEAHKDDGVEADVPEFVKEALRKREPDSFYYNHAKKYLRDKIDEVYNSHINSGYKFIRELGKTMEDIFYELEITVYPDFDELKDEVIEACNKIFEKLKTKIKDKEAQKNVEYYKGEIDTVVLEIKQKKDGKYVIMESLFLEKLTKYKDDAIKLSTRRFYGNFRKNLGKKKMKMLEEFRYFLKYAIRFVKDLTKVEESEYTRVLTDIYLEKKKKYKGEYAKSRRIIAKNLDAAFYDELDNHYKKIQAIIESKVQEIRLYIINKISNMIKELYNEMHVELQTERTQLNNEKELIITKFDKLIQANKKAAGDLKSLEPSIVDNKVQLTKCQSEFNTISQEVDKINKKLDVIYEIERNFIILKNDIIKQYRLSKATTELFVVNENNLSEMYRSIENLVKDSIFTLDDLQFEEDDIKRKKEILQEKEKEAIFEIEIREKFLEHVSEVENKTKQDSKKLELEDITGKIEEHEETLEEIYVKKSIILDELHYLTRDNILEIPKTLKIILPKEEDELKNQPFDDFLTSLKDHLAIENDAFRRLVMTFDEDIHDYDDHLIFIYNFAKISNDINNMKERAEAEFDISLSKFNTKLTLFHNKLKDYIELRKKTEKGEDDKDTLDYLMKNYFHLKYFLEKLKKNSFIPDFGYIIINPDKFTKQIKNEKPELLTDYTPLVTSYNELEKQGTALNETFSNLVLQTSKSDLDSHKILWYKGILKKYIQRSKILYGMSYDHNELTKVAITNILDSKIEPYLAKPILLQYEGDVWGESYEKRHLRVVGNEKKFPYILKEIKDEYALNRIIDRNDKKSKKLTDLKDYINLKAYNVLEETNKKLYLYEKNEIDELKLLNHEGKFPEGSIRNFLTYVNFGEKNVYIYEIINSVSKVLGEGRLNYDGILEVIKYLKENPKLLNLKDIIDISIIILHNANIFFIPRHVIVHYILTIFELLNIEITVKDIEDKDIKERVMVYLNTLKTYHYEKLRIRDKIKGYIKKYLIPKKDFETLNYNPKLYEFIFSLNQSIDGNPKLYELSKKASNDFFTKLIDGIRKGISDFMVFVVTTIMKDNPKLKEEEYYDDNYSNVERDRFRYANYIWDRVNINEVLTLFFYVVNPGLRIVIRKHFILTDIQCLKDYENYDFKELFTFLKSSTINEDFRNYLKSLGFFEVPPLVILLRFFFNENYKQFFTFDKIKEVIGTYFKDEIFDKNTKEMIAKLLYSFLFRLNYHSVTFFDNDIKVLLDKSDIELLNLFHTILNKINYILYCKNDKIYLERYQPTNLLYNKPFKLDAFKIFHEFINTLSEYIKRPVINFFEISFVDTVTKLLIDFFKYTQTLLDISKNKSSFETEELNKIETFFKLNYAFSKNKNMIEDSYEELVSAKPYFKDMHILYARKIKYDHDTDQVTYENNLNLEDIFDEKAFKLLTELLFKEHFKFSDLNKKFAEFMKKNNFVFPKFEKLKEKILEVQNENFYHDLYKYLYDNFQLLNIPQPIHELFFLFIKEVIDFSLIPKKIVDNELQASFSEELKNKYLRYVNLVKQLVKCLFNFYYYDEAFHCEPFGFFTNEEIPHEQKILKLIQTPFVDIVNPTNHNSLQQEYKIENERIDFHFLKQFIPSSELMEKEDLDAEIFKFRYFISEISKFILHTILSKVPPEYLIDMNYDTLNIHIDDIFSNLHALFKVVSKVKAPEAEEIPNVPNAKGSIDNFDVDENKKFKFENIKYYFDNNLTGYLLNNNAIFKHFDEFTKNIDKFKQYFPSLSELYTFIDKRVNIINALNHPYYRKMVKTPKIIQIFVDVFKSFGIQLYEL